MLTPETYHRRGRQAHCTIDDGVPPPDPASAARAVRAVRIFLPIYLAGVCTLLLPALARVGGLELPVLSLLATASVVAMAIGAPTFLAWLGRQGHYDARKGLRFQLGAALLRNQYVPVGGHAEATQAPSPLGSTGRDAARAASDLETAGLPGLAMSLRAVASEGEITKVALQRVQLVDPAVAAEAEHELGRLRDQVTRLCGPSPGDPESIQTDLDDLLNGLRRANDRMRGR